MNEEKNWELIPHNTNDNVKLCDLNSGGDNCQIFKASPNVYDNISNCVPVGTLLKDPEPNVNSWIIENGGCSVFGHENCVLIKSIKTKNIRLCPIKDSDVVTVKKSDAVSVMDSVDDTVMDSVDDTVMDSVDDTVMDSVDDTVMDSDVVSVLETRLNKCKQRKNSLKTKTKRVISKIKKSKSKLKNLKECVNTCISDSDIESCIRNNCEINID